MLISIAVDISGCLCVSLLSPFAPVHECLFGRSLNAAQSKENVVAKKKSAKDDSQSPSFEQSLDELEAIVGELESGKLGLSDALECYEAGVKHLKSCHQLLERAERRIELLSGVDADGSPITEPFEAEEHSSLEEKAAARGKRRSSGKGPSAGGRQGPQDGVDDDQRLF